MRTVPVYILSVCLIFICTQLSSEGLDRKFYNQYLDSLNQKDESEANLKRNLFRATKEAIYRNDRNTGPQYIKEMQLDGIQFELLDQDGAFARGILKELENFRPAKYMYIVESEPYMVLLSYSVNPERSLYVEPIQNFVIKTKSPEKNPEEGDSHGE